MLDINKGLERKLKEASALPSEGTGRAYVLSYSSETQLNISSNKADVQTNVVITGGDFFKFHPMKLLSGYYFTESDLNYDRIVIDDNLAWQLYGSYDVDGMKVYIAEKPFIIAAVVKSDYNIVSKEIYGDKPRAYISFDAMQIILESETYVTCFEAILPEPINGFGIGAVKEIISSDEKLIEYVQNTGRYSFITLLRKLGNMSTLSARKTNVIPPYWENDARILDIRLAIILFFSLMSTLIPLSFIVFLLISVFRRRKIYFNDIKRIASEKFERISQNRKGK
ncbi:MAG: ABC transporter permease [Clostridiales bacterium]|nr:ABC transporter permease [Clostridiales bacterium]